MNKLKLPWNSIIEKGSSEKIKHRIKPLFQAILILCNSHSATDSDLDSEIKSISTPFNWASANTLFLTQTLSQQ